MLIGIDTWSLRPPLTGIGHFVHRLTAAMLPLLRPDQELVAFNDWGVVPIDRNFLTRAETLNSEQAAGGQAPRAFRHPRGKAYVLLRQMYPVRKIVRALQAVRFHRTERKIDLFHAVNYVAPERIDKPILPVIYDLSFIRLPETHPRERITWLERGLKRVSEVPIVQTISEFSKSEIVNLLGIPADRIHVTYPAPSGHFQPQGPTDGVYLRKYQVESRKYFLVVGTREPRKNFKTVAEAYTALPDSLRSQFPLLWVGASGWGDLSLSLAVSRVMAAGQIRCMGYVPDIELAALYRNTALFMMPSIYEGFGMPIVEALACGASVAISKIPVFEEIAGSCARQVNSADVDGWRQVMNDACEESSRANGCSKPAADLSRFSWEASAATTLTLYDRLQTR